MVGINAEPGTGTEYSSIITPEDSDSLRPPTWTDESGRTWTVGGEYLDTQIGDLCTLEGVFKRSSWAHTGDTENGVTVLRFEYARFKQDPDSWTSGTIEIRINDFDGEDELTLDDRFLERWTAPESWHRGP